MATKKEKNERGLYNRHNFGIVKFAAKDESRWAISGVYVEPGKTVATDGHRMAVVTAPNHSAKISEFPEVPGVKIKALETPGILPADVAAKLAKEIPTREAVPVLNNAAPIETEAGKMGFVHTDLQSSHPTIAETVKGTFPNYESVFPTKNPKMRIGFNVKYMLEICQFLSKFVDARKQDVVLSLYTEAQAFKLEGHNPETGQDATFLLMPLRIE